MNIDKELFLYLKKILKFSNNQKIFDMNKKFKNIEILYEEFLKSDRFKILINLVKSKNDEEYLKIFLRHSKNYLNLHLKNKDADKEKGISKNN